MQTCAAWVAWAVPDPQEGGLVWARVSQTADGTLLFCLCHLLMLVCAPLAQRTVSKEMVFPTSTLPLGALGAIQGPLVRPSQCTRGAKTMNDKRRLARD